MTQEEEKEAMEAARRIVNAAEGGGSYGMVAFHIDAEAVARALLSPPPSARGEIERLRAVLKGYSEDYCEGWCKDSDSAFDDCGGCKARLSLIPASAPGEGGKSNSSPAGAAPIASTAEANPWRTIDSAPKDGTEFLCWVEWRDTHCWHVGYWRAGRWCVERRNGDRVNPKVPITHWQPLPAPPIANTHDQ